MPKLKLTKRAIDELQPETIDKFYWDTEIVGLGLKVTPKGRKSFLVQYRPGGRKSPTRKVFLGQHGTVTVKKAKREASQILGLRAEGRDPAMERKQARERLTSDRFSDVAHDFIELHVSQNRTSEETTRILKTDVLPKWKSRSIHQITKRDVNSILDAVDARGSKFMTNRTLAALRKLFRWTVSRGIIVSSPCEGISARNKETARDRVLSDRELLSVINATSQVGSVFRAIIQVLVFTAQRRGEVSDMTWRELDLDNRLWTIPSERTKNGKPHDVHLTDQVLATLEQRPHVGKFVFTSNGRTPFSGFSKSKKFLDEASGITGWRIHDIRRTVATGMASIGIAPHIADKVMNHQSGTISGVAAVYQRHEFLEERKTALEAWARYVQSLMDDQDREN